MSDITDDTYMYADACDDSNEPPADTVPLPTPDNLSSEDAEGNDRAEMIDSSLPEPDEPNCKTYLISTVDGLNVRSQPDTSSSILGSLDKGDGVPMYEKTGNWYRTIYKRRTAYVYAGYVRELNVATGSDRIEAVISQGESLLGYPYVYGATRLHDGGGHLLSGFDDTRFDCSSLIQYIFYYGAGVNLRLTTRTQIYQGVHVDGDQLKRGDVIFFTNSSRRNNTGIERVGHVAMYLGNGYILHTASDHAVIEPLTPARQANYIEARRFVD